MFGAFGKMNLTSSNLLRFRQFSASQIHPTPLSFELVRAILLNQLLDTYESPRPWATITVAVCRLRAGTTNAAGLAMMMSISK
jgi:hypothetical protein